MTPTVRPSLAVAAPASVAVVSVCIVNWNCAPLLRACLNSLLRRAQGVACEVIVVDNASSDGAADLVAREFPEVILIRNRANVGFAAACNQAARLARGRYLFFLNNDTDVPPGSLAQLVAYAARHPQVGMIGPRLLDARGQYQISYRRRPTLAALLHKTALLRWTGWFKPAYVSYRRGDYRPDETRPVEALLGAAVFLPRAVFAECGGWDEGYAFGGEDLELSARVGRTHPVVFLAGVDILHHGRVSSRQNVAFATPGVAAGYVRYLRTAGVGRWRLFAYKALVTLDAPVLFAGKLAQSLWRRWNGRAEKAAQSLRAACGAWHFLASGLRRFWRA